MRIQIQWLFDAAKNQILSAFRYTHGPTLKSLRMKDTLGFSDLEVGLH